MKKTKKFINAEKFDPLRRFLDNRDALTKHISATELAYALAVCTLSDNRLKGTERSAFDKVTNYSAADFGVKSIKRLYGWVTLKEFAELEKLSIKEVRSRLNRGELGALQKHPRKRTNIVMWPTSKCGTIEAESLQLGMSKWEGQIRGPSKIAKVSINTEDEDSLDEARNDLIFLGRKLGESSTIYEEAQELFYRGSFLNLWSCFEIFIKDSFGELVRRFPMALANLPDWKKLTLAYADLVLRTGGLQEITSLREELIASEIAKAEIGGRSISGLINVMKSIFDWPNDVYQRPYREQGVNLKTRYLDLNEIKEVRNVLAHQHYRQPEILKKSKRLRFLHDRPVIDKAYFKWAELVMSAIAHGIAEDIVAERLSPRGSG